jgi:hypothetical protein
VRGVGTGAHLLTAEVEWTCGSPTCDLHAYLCSPDEDAADPLAGCAIHAMGGSPLALVAEEPAPGKWVVYVASDAPGFDVAGTITMAES